MPAEPTYPIPKPERLHDALYQTTRKGVSTLQEQMQLEDDRETCSELLGIIWETASYYLDRHIPYASQDRQVLQKIKAEVLEQCPVLEEMYIDAWPITSYLRRRLKGGTSLDADHDYEYEHHSTGNHVTTATKLERKAGSGLHPSLPGAEKGPYNVGSSPRRGVRRSARLMKKEKEAMGIVEESADGEESEDNSEEEEVGPKDVLEKLDPSTSSEREMTLDAEVGHDVEDVKSESEMEESPLSRFSRDSSESDETEPLYANSPARVHVDSSDDSLGSTLCASMSKRLESPDARRSRTSMTPPITTSTVNGGASTAQWQSGIVPVLGRGSAPLTTPGLPLRSLAIQDMLLARGLPGADADRITRILASLGIADEAYLRVFARLAPRSREAWVSEMRKKGQLSEIQTLVVVDMLDAAVVDL